MKVLIACEESQSVTKAFRKLGREAFSVTGDFKDATLFGQNLFAKSGRYLTICEGELDAE